MTGFPLYVERQALFDAMAGLGIDVTSSGNVSKIEIDSLKITLTVFPRGPHGGVLAIDDPLKIEIAVTGQADKPATPAAGERPSTDYSDGATEALSRVQHHVNRHIGPLLHASMARQIINEVRQSFAAES